MKENPGVDGAAKTGKSIQRGVTPRGKTQKKSPLDSANFSPEKIQDQASTKSTVLIQMLERDEPSHYYRHWGINE